MEYVSRTDVGRQRDHNEDTVATADFDGATLLAVADGMGGHAAGDVASETAIEAFVASLEDGQPVTRPGPVLVDAVETAHEAVTDAADDHREYGTMGTTLVAALVDDGTATVVNVGDSRAYHVTDAAIEQVTVDHSLVQELVDNGTIDADEADDHPHRHVLAQSLGGDDGVDPDVFERDLTGTLVLCSDGLTEEVPESSIHEVVAGRDDLAAAAAALIDLANDNGGSDNVSVVLGRPE